MGRRSRAYLNALKVVAAALTAQDLYEAAVAVQLEMLSIAKALPSQQQLERDKLAQILGAIADSYTELERNEEALLCCVQAVAEFSKLGNPPIEDAVVGAPPVLSVLL